MFKGTLSLISSHPPHKEGNARFTTVPFQPWTVYRASEESSIIKYPYTKFEYKNWKESHYFLPILESEY